MAIQFRSTPKRAQRDTSVDAILSRQDFEDAVAAVNMTLADIAKQTGINRQYLSEFKSGDRNLRAEMRQTLRDFFEAKGVEFIATENDGMEEGWSEFDPPAQEAKGNPAVRRELDTVMRDNDQQLALPVSYEFDLFLKRGLSRQSNEVNEELMHSLAYEAILRRVLAGSFKARYAEGERTNHAELIAQGMLHGLSEAGSVADPEPLADSSAENSVADAASGGAARGKGPSAREQSTGFPY